MGQILGTFSEYRNFTQEGHRKIKNFGEDKLMWWTKPTYTPDSDRVN